MGRLFFILFVCSVIAGPSSIIDFKRELDDHFQHREVALVACSYTVKGWIPYNMRVDKKKFYLPAYANPWDYIKDYDPNNKLHMKILESSLEGEESK